MLKSTKTPKVLYTLDQEKSRPRIFQPWFMKAGFRKKRKKKKRENGMRVVNVVICQKTFTGKIKETRKTLEMKECWPSPQGRCPAQSPKGGSEMSKEIPMAVERSSKALVFRILTPRPLESALLVGQLCARSQEAVYVV